MSEFNTVNTAGPVNVGPNSQGSSGSFPNSASDAGKKVNTSIPQDYSVQEDDVQKKKSSYENQLDADSFLGATTSIFNNTDVWQGAKTLDYTSGVAFSSIINAATTANVQQIYRQSTAADFVPLNSMLADSGFKTLDAVYTMNADEFNSALKNSTIKGLEGQNYDFDFSINMNSNVNSGQVTVIENKGLENEAKTVVNLTDISVDGNAFGAENALDLCYQYIQAPLNNEKTALNNVDKVKQLCNSNVHFNAAGINNMNALTLSKNLDNQEWLSQYNFSQQEIAAMRSMVRVKNEGEHSILSDKKNRRSKKIDRKTGNKLFGDMEMVQGYNSIQKNITIAQRAVAMPSKLMNKAHNLEERLLTRRMKNGNASESVVRKFENKYGADGRITKRNKKKEEFREKHSVKRKIERHKAGVRASVKTHFESSFIGRKTAGSRGKMKNLGSKIKNSKLFKSFTNVLSFLNNIKHYIAFALLGALALLIILQFTISIIVGAYEKVSSFGEKASSSQYRNLGEESVATIREYANTSIQSGISEAENASISQKSKWLSTFNGNPYSFDKNDVDIETDYKDSDGNTISGNEFYEIKEIMGVVELFTQGDYTPAEYLYYLNAVYNATHTYSVSSPKVTYCNAEELEGCTNLGTGYHSLAEVQNGLCDNMKDADPVHQGDLRLYHFTNTSLLQNGKYRYYYPVKTSPARTLTFTGNQYQLVYANSGASCPCASYTTGKAHPFYNGKILLGKYYDCACSEKNIETYECLSHPNTCLGHVSSTVTLTADVVKYDENNKTFDGNSTFITKSIEALTKANTEYASKVASSGSPKKIKIHKAVDMTKKTNRNDFYEITKEIDWKEEYDVSLSYGTFDVNASENAQKVYQFLISSGYSRAAACGILGNWLQESGFDPYAYGKEGHSSKGTYYPPHLGIAQWDEPGRWAGCLNYCKTNGLDPVGTDPNEALLAQLNFAVYEMDLKGYNHFADVSDTLEGAAEVAEYICRNYEMPGNYDTEVPLRQDNAYNYYMISSDWK